MIRALIIASGLCLLVLPLMGIKSAAIVFISILAVITLLSFIRRHRHIFRIGIKVPAIYKRTAVLVTVMAVLLLPVYGDNYLIDVSSLSGIYIILAMGLNVVVGFAGLLNLGFAAFYAIGAYSTAILTTRLDMPFWLSMPMSVTMASFLGILLAIPALRLRGDYLAIVTLGFGEIIRIVLNNWDSLTNGPNGILNIPSPSIGGFKINRLSHYYYMVLLFVFLCIFVVRRVHNSRVGRAWLAIREDETAAEAMGIDTVRYKLLAFSFGAFWAGLAGALFAGKMHFVSPESFTFMESVLILCMVIIGGLGSIPGVILGAVILIILPEVLREFQTYRMLALGSGLVLMMIFRPQGLLGGRGGAIRG